jgi:predicted NUDIX family phosphoesterase
MNLDEKVLCVPRAQFPQDWLLENGALRLCERDFLHEAQNMHWMFKRRGNAENDPSFKQIVPYCVAMRQDGTVLAYPRHGSETRLHGLHSIGVGGHVNDGDEVTGSLFGTLLNGALREIGEEMGEGMPCDLSFRGILNEEVTSAGGVHFGVVFSFSVPADFQPGLLPELAGGRFMSISALGALPLEHWSRLALTLL